MRIKWPAPKPRDYELWEDWFAWRPVFIGEQLVWLEHIERKPIQSCWDNDDMLQRWEYRFKEKQQ